METISGVLSVFHRIPGSGWCVCGIGDETAVGVLPVGVTEGSEVEATGKFSNHPKHGRRFEIATMAVTLPRDAASIVSYLIRHFDGVGPKTARLIVEKLGADRVFDVLDNDPDALAKIRGVGRKRANELLAQWAALRQTRDADAFFADCGITPAAVRRILFSYMTVSEVKKYETPDLLPAERRAEIASEIRRNPYELIERVDGIGFKKADAIARRVGVRFDSDERARAGLIHILKDKAKGDGHCYLPRLTLFHEANDLLYKDTGRPDDDVLERALAQASVTERIVIEDEDRVFHAPLHRAEMRVAAAMERFAGLSVPALPLHDADWLTDEQRSAAALALAAPASAVIGLPGTGKTTTMKVVVDSAVMSGLSVALAAPTGKAAKRLSQQTGREAKTIHRLLEYHPAVGFARNENNPIEADLLVVDEASMLDLQLTATLLAAIDPGRTRVLLVGDTAQLPSVGPGMVLADFIGCGRFPVSKLTKILRQDEAGGIVLNAHRINAGEMPIGDRTGEFRLVERDEPERIADAVVEIVTKAPGAFGLDPLTDVQILCPQKKSAVGAFELNRRASEALNPNGRPIPGVGFGVGDRVIQTRNDYGQIAFEPRLRGEVMRVLRDYRGADRDARAGIFEKLAALGRCVAAVFNGESGVVTEFDAHSDAITVRFDDGLEAVYAFDQAREDLQAAWAITVHKSQGSEYPLVVIPVSTANYIMLARNLLYTAVTRGARYVYLVGDAKAIGIAVKNNQVMKRNTWLANRLREQQSREGEAKSA